MQQSTNCKKIASERLSSIKGQHGVMKEALQDKLVKLVKRSRSIPYEMKDNLLFQKRRQGTGRRLCIPPECVKEVLEIEHDAKHHGE